MSNARTRRAPKQRRWHMRFLYRPVMLLVLLFSVPVLAPGPDAAIAGTRGKNPCSMKNPCDMKHEMKNQGDMKAMPAGGPIPIRKMAIKDAGYLASKGEKLWGDASLGTSGLSCSSCHPDGAGLKADPWPKFIKGAGDTYTVDQMINFCMINPMKAEPLEWNSKKMTALAAYVAANSGTGAPVVEPKR